MKYKIGMPRALLFHHYSKLWISFFEELHYQVIVSPETNKKILERSIALANDESCLSAKLLLGHIEAIKDKVDYIFLPRYTAIVKGELLCDKFCGINDITTNTFPNLKILDFSVDDRGKLHNEFIGFLKIGIQLKNNPISVVQAYKKAKKKLETYYLEEIKKQEEKLKNNQGKPVIIIVSHAYNIYDSFIGQQIIKYLEKMDILVINADIVDKVKARELSKNLSEDLYWTFNKEIIGGLEYYRKQVDGIIFLMTFPCGPDSLVVTLCQNKIKDVPLIVLTVDEQAGDVGLKTRLESFVDILKMKQKRNEKN
ncbi:MAG: acyl-CoA dehydratase activase-related protein [bacterium]